MLESIRRRGGPECFAERRAGPGAVLGTSRLAIVGRAKACRPQTDARRQVWLAYNGELYGFGDLRNELAACGYRFHTASETGVVLNTYLEWGAEGLRRLNGMFALVLHDERDGSVLAARDHVGIKLLYYAGWEGTCYFASGQKALLKEPGPVRTVEPGTFMKNGVSHRYFRLDSRPLRQS